MTKVEIVQELLDKGHITAENAVVLLTITNQQSDPGAPYFQYPYFQYPYFTDPNTTGSPPVVYCNNNTSVS
jgi:hypothetical protein